jgi:predicted secreted Zn-dependent protease
MRKQEVAKHMTPAKNGSGADKIIRGYTVYDTSGLALDAVIAKLSPTAGALCQLIAQHQQEIARLQRLIAKHNHVPA